MNARQRASNFGVGPQIRDWRLRKEMTQTQLAAAVGMNRTSITHIENDSRPLKESTLLAIGKVLGFKVKITLE